MSRLSTPPVRIINSMEGLGNVFPSLIPSRSHNDRLCRRVHHSVSSPVSRPVLASVPAGEATFLFTTVEVVVAIIVIAVLGTLLARRVARLSQKVGASKGVAKWVRQWTGALMVVLSFAAVLGITGISSQLTTLSLSGIGGSPRP